MTEILKKRIATVFAENKYSINELIRVKSDICKAIYHMFSADVLTVCEYDDMCNFIDEAYDKVIAL